MKLCWFLTLLCLILSSCANEPVATSADREPSGFFSFSKSNSSKALKMRFQIEPYKWDHGVRVAEYRTSEIDVTYKAIKVEPAALTFKVYISNVGKKILRVDSSLFNITSLSSKKSVVAESSLWADEKKPVAKLTLQPGESASSELKFAVSEPLGRWSLKNKLTDHTFLFMVIDSPN